MGKHVITTPIATERVVVVKRAEHLKRIAGYDLVCPDHDCGRFPGSPRNKALAIQVAYAHINDAHDGEGSVFVR